VVEEQVPPDALPAQRADVMKRLERRALASALILTAALALSRSAHGPESSALLPRLQEVGRQLEFDFRSLSGIVQFHSPSMSRLSIPYLTIQELKAEASLTSLPAPSP